MTITHTTRAQKGFTLVESMIALFMFLLVCGAVFKMLSNTQRRYQTESQVTGSFQDAQLALDQIVRDANDAGYPPSSNFSNITGPGIGCAKNVPCQWYSDSAIAWFPGYINLNPCTIGGTCTSPSQWDAMFEVNVPGVGVQWIHYALNAATNTLMRGVSSKKTNQSAFNVTAGFMYPYITNVMNNAPAAQIAQFQASYPNMFPGGNPQPVFQFYCLNPAAPPQTILCQNAVGNINLPNGTTIPASSPQNVVDVEITLIIQTPQVDQQSGAIRLVELNGRGHVVNPD